MDTKTIGARISERRKKLNISQSQLAQKLFISPQAVGKWERGESVPDIITFNRLAKVLGVDLNYFSEDFTLSKDKNTTENLEVETDNEAKENRKNEIGRDMSFNNWLNADFSGLKNINKKFSYSNLKKCLFVDSEMSELFLEKNEVDSCDFTNSKLRDSLFKNSNLTNTVFIESSLKGTTFLENHIRSCDFSSANLSNAVLKKCKLEKNTFTNVVWSNTSFSETLIADIVFESELKDCHFENCLFTGVKFQNLTIINTFFKNNSKLKNVSFENCKVDKLTYAFLKNEKAELSNVEIIS